MPLLNDQLTVWEIGFRWAGYDPDKLWLRLPPPVRDNFRTLMDAILQGHLYCSTISLDKRGDDQDAPHLFYIRDDIDAVYECIQGHRFPRKLLHWAEIERWALHEWCVGHGIPLPDFWFPVGWKLHFEWPEMPTSGASTDTQEVPSSSEATPQPEPPKETPATDLSQPDKTPDVAAGSTESQEKHRIYQRRRIACQEIAKNLRKTDPGITIAAMVEHQAIGELGGGQWNAPEVVRRWLSEIAPPEVKARRGRPRKNPTAAK